MTDRPLYIVGTSGLALEMAQLAAHCGRRCAGFIAQHSAEVGADIGPASVVGDDDWLLAQDDPADVLLGIGIPKARLAVARRYREAAHLAFPNFVHPRALVDDDWVRMGVGNVITAGCVFTVNVQIASFALFNLNTTVGHSARIGTGTVINPLCAISGNVTIGDGVLIGTGAQILEGRSVGDAATVGAGAVVNKDVDPGTVVVGVPARPLHSG